MSVSNGNKNHATNTPHIEDNQMPKLTSGLTRKEQLKVLQSIDSVLKSHNQNEQRVLQAYRRLIAQECLQASAGEYGWAVNA
jgi:hydrogenase maturation factor